VHPLFETFFSVHCYAQYLLTLFPFLSIFHLFSQYSPTPRRVKRFYGRAELSWIVGFLTNTGVGAYFLHVLGAEKVSIAWFTVCVWANVFWAIFR
jgi:hypothetical protein